MSVNPLLNIGVEEEEQKNPLLDISSKKKEEEEVPGVESKEFSTPESRLSSKIEEYYQEKGYTSPQSKFSGFQKELDKLKETGNLSKDSAKLTADNWGLVYDEKTTDNGQITYTLSLPDQERELYENVANDMIKLETGRDDPDMVKRLGTYAGSFNKRALSFLSDAPKSVAIVANKLTPERLRGDVEKDLLYKAGKWIEEKVEETVGYADPEYTDDFANQIFSGFGDMLSFATGAGVATKAAPKVMVKSMNVTPAATTAFMGAAVNAVPEYEEIKNRATIANASTKEEYVEAVGGVDLSDEDKARYEEQYDNLNGKEPEDIAWKSFMRNAIAGSMEAMPIATGLSRLKKLGGNKITPYLLGALESGTEEALQESMTQYFQNQTAKELYDSSRKYTEGMKDAATTGFVIGGMTFGMAGAIDSRLKDKNISYEDKKLLEKARENVKDFEGTLPENGGEVVYEEVANEKIQELEEAQKALTEELGKENINDATKEAINTELDNINEQIKKEKDLAIDELSDSDAQMEQIKEEKGKDIQEGLDKVSDAAASLLGANIPEYSLSGEPSSKNEIEQKIDEAETSKDLKGISIKNDDVLKQKLEEKQEAFGEKITEVTEEKVEETEEVPAEEEIVEQKPEEDAKEIREVREEGQQIETEEPSMGDMPEVDQAKTAQEKIEETQEQEVETDVGFTIPIDARSKIKKIGQKYFTPEGDLPKSVHKEWVKAEGRRKKELVKAKQLKRDFDKAAREVYGKELSKENLKELNEVLGELGTDPIYRRAQMKRIPEKIRKPLGELRNHIDLLSKEMVREGVVEGDLALKFDNNQGFYVTRSYKAHSDKKWGWDKIPDEIKNRAKSFIRAENPELSEAEIEGELKSYLDNPEMPLGVIKAGKLGAKDLGILSNRKDVPEPIRALLGEYGDPVYNYATSVAKMSDLLAKNQFLGKVKEQGLGDFLYEKPIGDYIRQISAEGSKTMEPLNGLYTTPEIAEAFESFDRSKPVSNLLRLYMKINGLTKYGKTVLSPQTHARNYVSNFMFQVANGRNPLGAVKTTAEVISNKWKSLKGKDSQEYRDYIKRLTELGVIEDSTRAGEMYDVVKDAYKDLSDFETGSEKFAKKVIDKPIDFVNKMYQIEDDIHKIYAFETEYNRYKPVIEKQNPEASSEEVNKLTEEKAAEITRNTMPTYSLVPESIKMLRRVPLVGSFTSFPAEVVRTTYNTIELAGQELKNPETKNIGKKRVVGLLTSAIVPASLSIMSRYMLGIDKEDDEDIRRFLAPWNKNSDLVYLKSDKKGVYRFVDAGYSDPQNYLKKPINAMIKGDFSAEDIGDAVAEFFEPFLGEEILAGKLMDVRSNKSASGGKIYNEADPIGNQISDGIQYVWQGMSPGFIKQMQRIYLGATGQKKRGKEYGLADEILAIGAGQRITNVDVADSFYWKLRRHGESLSDTQNDYKSLLRDKNVPKRLMKKAHKKAEQQIKDILSEAHLDFKAATRLGVPIEELQSTIDKMRVGNYGANKSVRGFVEYGDIIDLDKETGQLY